MTGPVKRCPTCGATSTTEDRFCEADGATLVEVAPPPKVGPPCPSCGQGTLESDGFCSACGRRPPSSRPTPSTLAPGAKLAGGVVSLTRSIDEALVVMPGGATALVAIGDATAIEREADVLERIGGHGPFPSVLECGVDELAGSFLALSAIPSDAQSLGAMGKTCDVARMLTLLHAVLDAAVVVERLGFAWEPQRDDMHVRADGSLRVSRVRVPRKLAGSERLDARSVLEALGTAFVPAPALEGPPRAFRLLLPHMPMAGEPGSTIDDVRAELAVVAAERPLPPDPPSRIAGVCDRGLRRPHNEDAMASASGVTGGEPWSVLVVCDGVSSSSHAEQASAVAAKTACDALAHFARSGDVTHEAGAGAVTQAIRAAHIAVCAQGIERAGGDPPGTTIVAALVWRRRVTVGWVGDSRAYWLSEHGSEQLTRDHSWANEAIERGEVSEVEAALSPLAHALTRCLGPLEVVDPDAPGGAVEQRIQEITPDVRARDLPGAGWIMLCSDGLWNYLSAAKDLAAQIQALGPEPSAAAVARRLVNHALMRGGQDNTTVLVHRHR